MSEKETTKSIKLNKLKDGDYRLWIIQLYKCLDIVLGMELKPIVPDDDGNNADRRAKRRRLLKNCHDLALEALLRAHLDTTIMAT
jgi:hypothetical protein